MNIDTQLCAKTFACLQDRGGWVGRGSGRAPRRSVGGWGSAWFEEGGGG